MELRLGLTIYCIVIYGSDGAVAGSDNIGPMELRLGLTIYYTVEPLWKGQECLFKVTKFHPFPCTILYKSCLFYPSWQATSFERPASWVAFIEGFHCIIIYGWVMKLWLHVVIPGLAINWSISQIPQCISSISHNAPFCNWNVHMCAHFCYKMEHFGIFNWCIVGFVR